MAIYLVLPKLIAVLTWYLARRWPIQPPAVLGAGDVAGHPAGQVGDPVDQRHAERRGQGQEASAAARVTSITAVPRRGIRRYTAATAGSSSVAASPATSISSTMSRSRYSSLPAR